MVQTPDDIQQGRLTAPRGAHDCREFPLLNIKVNTIQRMHRDGGFGIYFGDSFGSDDSHSVKFYAGLPPDLTSQLSMQGTVPREWP